MYYRLRDYRFCQTIAIIHDDILIGLNLFFFQRITWNPSEVDRELCILKGKSEASILFVVVHDDGSFHPIDHGTTLLFIVAIII